MFIKKLVGEIDETLQESDSILEKGMVYQNGLPVKEAATGAKEMMTEAATGAKEMMSTAENGMKEIATEISSAFHE